MISKSWFFSVAVVTIVAAHMFDLLGTYKYQPNFEHEVNPVYNFLVDRGYEVGWPQAFAGKSIVIIGTVLMLRAFVRGRSRYYPEPGQDCRVFITTFVFGRPLSWVKTLYCLPTKWGGFWMLLCGTFVFATPYMFVFGYNNLAGEYGWLYVGYPLMGSHWLDLILILYAVAVLFFTVRQLWVDYNSQPGAPQPQEQTASPSAS